MKTRRHVFLSAAVILAAAMLLVAGCEEYADYTPSASDLTAIAEQYQGDDKEMIQGTAVARYLTAEAAQLAQEQAQVEIAQLEATRQAAAAQEQRQYLAMTTEAQATANALAAGATSQAVNALGTQQAYTFQSTATGQAIQMTAQVEAIHATATIEARNWAATVTAQHKADLATATRRAKDDRATATQESLDATAGAVHATMTRQAEKREVVLGYTRDYGLPLLLLAIAVGIGALLVWGVSELRKRPVVMEQSLLGDSQQVRIPTEDGRGYTFVDLDLMPAPVVTVRRDGSVDAPILRDEVREEADKERDQHLNALSRPRFGAGHRGQSTTLPATQPRIPGLRSLRIVRTLDQLGRAGAMPTPLIESLQADWEER